MQGASLDAAEADAGCAAKILVFFLRAMKLFAILALLGDIVAYCLSMKGSIESPSVDNYSKAFFVLSSTGFCVIALFQIVAELEPKWFMLRVRVMKFWIVRGFFLGWQGIHTISSSESVAKLVTDVSSRDFRTAGDVVGWSLIGIGACYILMSCLCLKKWVGLKKLEDLEVRLIPDERMDSIGKNLGISGDSRDATYALREAHSVIGNMAIVLDLTSSKAWSIFNGSSGAEEARRWRADRHAASMPMEQNPSPDYYNSPVVPVVGVPVSAGEACAVDDSEDESPRARRARERDADLETAYYREHQ